MKKITEIAPREALFCKGLEKKGNYEHTKEGLKISGVPRALQCLRLLEVVVVLVPVFSICCCCCRWFSLCVSFVVAAVVVAVVVAWFVACLVWFAFVWYGLVWVGFFGLVFLNRGRGMVTDRVTMKCETFYQL